MRHRLATSIGSTAGPQRAGRPVGFVDEPIDGSVVGTDVALRGWVLDDHGLEGVSVEVDGQPWDTLPLNEMRPDVRAAHPDRTAAPRREGWWGVRPLPPALAPGPRTLVFRAIRRDGAAWEIGRTSVVVDPAADGPRAAAGPHPDRAAPAAGFVWMFGASGAGKDHVIREVHARPDHPLRRILDLAPRVAPCWESLDAPSPERNRLRFLDLLQEPPPARTSILIKMQWVDLHPRHQILDLSRRFPAVSHRIVFLFTDPAELRRRNLGRGARDVDAWSLARSVDDCRGEQDHMLQTVRLLAEQGFAVTCVAQAADDFVAYTVRDLATTPADRGGASDRPYGRRWTDRAVPILDLDFDPAG